MKKSIFFIAATLLLVFSSCEQKFGAYPNSSETTVPESDLLCKIKFLNDSLLAAKPTSKSFVQPGAWRRLQIIAADAGGAYSGGKAGAFYTGFILGPEAAPAGAVIGALIGGACASYVVSESVPYEESRTRLSVHEPVNIKSAKEKTIIAYSEMLSENKNISDYTPKIVLVDYPIINDDVTLLGAKHNIILDKLITTDQIASTYSRDLSEIESVIINSKEFSDQLDVTLESIIDNINYGSSMTFDGDDITSKLMNMFFDILTSYPDNLDDIEFIINKYIELVNASNEISESDKELIYCGLSVAASSSEFWSL